MGIRRLSQESVFTFPEEGQVPCGSLGNQMHKDWSTVSVKQGQYSLEGRAWGGA